MDERARKEQLDRLYQLLAENSALRRGAEAYQARLVEVSEKMAAALEKSMRRRGRLYLDPSAAYRYIRDKKSAGVIRRLTEH